MIPFSKSPSRIPGWLGCLRTVPVVGPAVIAALIASPSASVMLATGIVGGAAVIAPDRIGAAAAVVCATTSASTPAVLASRPLTTFWQPVLLPVTIAIELPAGAPA